MAEHRAHSRSTLARFRRQFARFALPLAGCASFGCGTAGSSDHGAAVGAAGTASTGGAGQEVGPGAVPITLQASAASSQELARLRAELDAQASLDAPGFAAKTKVPFSALGMYDPATAPGMDLVQNSAVALDAAELSALSSEGFVVSQRQAYPSFFYGYQTIYAQDLPLYVSADSILFAVHKSYDAILSTLEQATLTADLTTLLEGMSTLLPKAQLSDSLRASTDVYLTTARSLLAGASVPPTSSKNAAGAKALYDLATAATGPSDVTVFGLKRTVDFSQFKPRGHYVGNPLLEQYFRALMWLGRIDLRIIDVQSDGTQVFERGQLEAAVALRGLMDSAGRAKWAEIDDAISAFVGEHDDMTPPQIDGLLNDVGVGELGLPALTKVPDATLAQAVIDGGYGAQRIASQIVINGLGSATLPLGRSFAFLGQRYTLDSNVFSNVVYDRVTTEPYRLMPSPLDVAYAALANDQAGMLLDSELTKYAYAPALSGMRLLADEHGADFWQENLYNLWLGALRSLSPSAAVATPAGAGLPSVAGTDSWGRRLLNTQLASWAELRHDTLLYAKPSYTGGVTCEFPAAYVDPYPEFYSALVGFAAHGATLVQNIPNAAYIATYFQRLGLVAATLRDMALDQRQGLPLSQAHLDFVNRAVHIQQGCGSPFADGWYPDLFFDAADAIEADPTIADVHTQPTDETGADVGRVLHVGTGAPHLMVVTVDGCTGAHAYVGLASSYYEQVTEQYERLTDPDWVTLLQSDPPAPPVWLPSAFTP